MDKNRKKIIINEIRYWKDHNLLPEKYSNFLLALYTEGDTDEDDNDTIEKNKEPIPYYLLWYVVNTLILFVPLTFFTLQNAIFLEITIGIVSILIGFLLHLKYKRHAKLSPSYSILMLAILTFLITISIADEYISNQWIIYSWTLLNGVAWLVLGRIRRYTSLQISGIAIFVIICVVIIFDII